MRIAVALFCLVAVAVHTGVTGLPKQDIIQINEIADFGNDQLKQLNGIIRRSTRYSKRPITCQLLGGQCQDVGDNCDGDLRSGRYYYCRRRQVCCIPPGCVFAGKSYPDKSVVEEACLNLVCNKGVWEQQGDVPDIKGDCGQCSVVGDPHIKPYEYHTFGLNQYINGSWYYEISNSSLSSTYTLSQKGLYSTPGSFGVYANIETCDGGAGLECLSKVIYSDPALGGDVEVLFPKKLYADDDTYCNTDDPSVAPGCETKIFNNAGSSVVILEGDTGKCTYCREIYIVGSKGFTVHVIVNPEIDENLHQAHIYAMPSLQNQLYGLCDRFTGSELNDYTLLNGSVITAEPLEPFIDSWKFNQ